MKHCKPPLARVSIKTSQHHGITLEDPYDWLYDRAYPEVKDTDVLDYLKAENAYTQEVLNPLAGLIEKLYQELKGRIPEEDEGVPVKDGPYFYSWRFKTGTEYKIWTRTHIRGGDAEIILDENTRSRGHDFYSLGGLAVSPDHKLLAFAEDLDGSERFTLRFKDLESGEILPHEIPGTMGSPVWDANSAGAFYLLVNEHWRPFRCSYHRLGRPPKEDRVVYEEKDASFFVGVGRTQSRKFVIVSSGDHVTNELRTLPANDPEASPLLISKRRKGHEYFADHAEELFYIRTNDVHKNFRIVTAPEDAPNEKNWREIFPPSDTNYIRGLISFKKFLALQERTGGVDRIRVWFHKGTGKLIEFPEPVYMASLGSTPEYDSDTFRIIYESMITPETVFDYDTANKKLITRKVQKIPSGYDKSGYQTRRLLAPARDGVKVPVTLLYKKGLKKDGSRPLHLYGYGAYGVGLPPWFSTNAFSLVDRGFVYAIAHVRGGDEMGYKWYQDGKLEKRLNTFHDFIDVAKFLIDEGYSGKGKISIEGRSAGGGLMGYVLNAAPDLWRAALMGVPFVDVLNTMLNDKLPLTPMEWPEWGNPIKDKKAFKFIRSYSPYDNIRRQNYPAMFVSGGLHDPRVTYWEPAKWVAKIRTHNTADTTVVLKTNMEAGHAGKTGRFTRLKEHAEEYAFLLKQFGIA